MQQEKVWLELKGRESKEARMCHSHTNTLHLEQMQTVIVVFIIQGNLCQFVRTHIFTCSNCFT